MSALVRPGDSVKLLSPKERADLERCENGIRDSISRAFHLFIIIRDAELYRETHSTFESYCKERWGYSSSYVGRNIRAIEAFDNIKKHLVPNGHETLPLPTNERQVRELSTLEPEQQAAAWAQAAAMAPKASNGQPKVTGAHVSKVVKKLKSQPAGGDFDPSDFESDQPAPDQPGVLVDELGIEVPEHLVPVFLELDLFKDLRKALSKARKLVTQISDGPANCFFNNDIHTVQAALNALKQLDGVVKYSHPYTTCPLCKATEEGCEHCKGQGWMPKPRYLQVPDKVKERHKSKSRRDQ